MNTPVDQTGELIRTGSGASFGKTRDERLADDVADRLISLDSDGSSSRTASNILIGAVGELYENGWQPADLIHVLRRGQTPQVMRLAAVLVLEQNQQFEGHTRAPETWTDQLDAIARQFPAAHHAVTSLRAHPHDSMLRGLRISAGRTDYMSANDQWLEVLALVGQLRSLPAWPRLGPLPSQWLVDGIRQPAKNSRSSDEVRTRGSSDTRALGRIRGLLAKAEATEFDEEAQTLMAKAQELMTRYSIDSAIIGGTNFDVLGKRLHIDSPHSAAKAHLLHEVALANRVKVIWDNDYGVATIVGAPVDVSQVELLFAALLVQANRSLADAVTNKRQKKTSASAFGKAFFYAYAVRIGARLAEADQAASQEVSRELHTDVLPVLAAQSVAVQTEFDRLFPSAKSGRRPSLDAHGWQSGHSAADRAILR